MINSMADNLFEISHENGVIPTKKLFQEKYKDELAKIGTPIVVTLKPQEDCEMLSSNRNIAKIIEKHGGEAIHGYICWLGAKELYLNFEPHIIYKSPTGEIYDPTPQEDKEDELLFIMIDGKHPLDKRNPAKYVPLSKEPEVIIFCKLNNELFNWIYNNSIYDEEKNKFTWEDNHEHQICEAGRNIGGLLLMHYLSSLIKD